MNLQNVLGPRIGNIWTRYTRISRTRLIDNQYPDRRTRPNLQLPFARRRDGIGVLDFTNGFHDTGNAMATFDCQRALAPRVRLLSPC